MIQLIINRGKKKEVEILFPEEWNELSWGQVSQLAPLLIAGSANELKSKLAIARALINDDKIFKMLDPAVLTESIFPLCNWVREGNSLTEQLLPVIDGMEILHGPCSNLGNIRLVEWDFCERLLESWIANPSEIDILAELAAVLYRPAKKDYDFERNQDGDPRVPFNDNLIPYYSKKIMEWVPVSWLLGIMLWYRGCREAVIDDHRIVFSSGSKQKVKSDPGYFDLMRAIAKEGTYGDFDKVEQLYLLTALHELKCSKEEAEAIKNKTKNNY